MEKNDPGQVFGVAPQSSPSSDEKTGPITAVSSYNLDYKTASGSYPVYLWEHMSWALKRLMVLVVISTPFVVPVVLYRDYQDLGQDYSDQQRQDRQLAFYICSWLLVSWLGLCVSFALGCAFPYIFRFVSRYVNPAHRRYWRVFRAMRRPVTLIGFLVSSYISFSVLVYNNDLLALNINRAADSFLWSDVIGDVLEQCSLWAGFYVVEKIAMLYVTIHYHFRSDLGRIAHSKDMQNALMALYETSISLHPVGTPEFANEDMLIANATGSEHGEYRVRASRYLGRLGIDSYALTSFFGNFLSEPESSKSHWLRPSSSYATVERAIANPKSAAALARRIWSSFVVFGNDKLRAQDIAEVLGPFRKEEAQGYFKVLDENESGDIQLDEMEWTVIEAGRIRNAIYRGMHSADHCINTFDWVMLAFLGAVMLLFILVAYVPTLKDIQDTIKSLALGFGFAIGRTVHHFLAGCIFVLFDHPYDIGDRVEVWNGSSNTAISLIVTRQSLLYTVFRRVDNWMEMQIGNEWLQQCRIENVTRSGANRQAVSMMIDIRTSFKDLSFLRAELEAFLRHKDNKRDYMPNLALAIVGVHELNKLELKCIFTHKSNWSIEPLRAARSMKFMCALVAAIRKIPITRPDGGPLGQEGRPLYNIMMSNEEAEEKLACIRAEQAATRIDAADKHDAAAGGVTIDVSGIQRGEDDAGDDADRVRKAIEEAAKKRAENAAKEAEELKAMALLVCLTPTAQPFFHFQYHIPPKNINLITFERQHEQ
ncbi:hypothetical protein B0T19DRAFT_482982 [Cercophora scortea]|uniref:Mechanosensitive ion channel protein Msy1/2-like transmembrane domain-containing protein n=1 Tax=Cercophora scortea TaxID=314031 RepID=A0AAE0IWW9_9PEZI|nr:hypothetical protein B0T19DRAFT_482982 [Cercophora scortea]